jgi:hypothetical protein
MYQKVWDKIYYRFLLKIWDVISPIYNYRRLEWMWQRLTKGYDDTELWDLDSNITNYILPRLKGFRQLEHKGISNEYETLSHEESSKLNEKEGNEYFQRCVDTYNRDIDKMILSFELMKTDKWDTIEEYHKQEVIINEGLQLFIKNYRSLWY